MLRAHTHVIQINTGDSQNDFGVEFMRYARLVPPNGAINEMTALIQLRKRFELFVKSKGGVEI